MHATTAEYHDLPDRKPPQGEVYFARIAQIMSERLSAGRY